MIISATFAPGSTTTLSGIDESFNPHLSTASLLKWNKWSASAKKYINNNSDHISLVDLVKTHGEMIDELYEWIFGQFTEIHGKDIEEVNKLIDAVTPESVKAERERNKREH